MNELLELGKRILQEQPFSRLLGSELTQLENTERRCLISNEQGLWPRGSSLIKVRNAYHALR